MPRKIAGLPLWAWGAVAVGAVALVVYVRRRGQAAGAPALVQPLPATAFGGGPPETPATLSPELVGGLFSDFVAGVVAVNTRALDLVSEAQLALIAQGETLERLAEVGVQGAIDLATAVVESGYGSPGSIVVTVPGGGGVSIPAPAPVLPPVRPPRIGSSSSITDYGSGGGALYQLGPGGIVRTFPPGSLVPGGVTALAQ